MNEFPINLETVSLDEQTNYRSSEIGKIKYYFGLEIKYQQVLTSKLSKYLTCFDYTGKILTVFLLFSLEQTFLHMLKEENNY